MEMLAMTAVVIVLGHLALGVILWLQVRKLYSYPGLLGFPVIGNLYYFYKSLFIFSLDGIEKNVHKVQKKCGKNGIHFQWVNGEAIVVVSSPDILKKLISNPNLADKPHQMYGGFRIFFGGPFGCTRSDNVWKQKRTEYNTFLKRSLIVKDYYNTFIKCTDPLVDKLLEPHSDLVEKVASFIYDVACRALFGIETSLVHDHKLLSIAKSINNISSLIAANGKLSIALSTILRPLEFALWKYPALLKEMYVSISNQSSLPGMTLSRQIASRNKKNNESEKTLVLECLEILLTSGHTTTSLLTSTIITLALQPDVQEIAWQEQFEIFGDDNREPTMEDLERMQFLDRLIKEALRFFSPPLIGKLATADINIDGITISRGTMVFYFLGYIKMDPKNFKNPNVFDPDRFLEENDSLRYTYSPFGIGIRNCPGLYFGTAVVKIAISKMIRRLKFRPVDEHFRFEDLKYKSYILTEIDNPPEILFEERQ